MVPSFYPANRDGVRRSIEPLADWPLCWAFPATFDQAACHWAASGSSLCCRSSYVKSLLVVLLRQASFCRGRPGAARGQADELEALYRRSRENKPGPPSECAGTPDFFQQLARRVGGSIAGEKREFDDRQHPAARSSRQLSCRRAAVLGLAFTRRWGLVALGRSFDRQRAARRMLRRSTRTTSTCRAGFKTFEADRVTCRSPCRVRRSTTAISMDGRRCGQCLRQRLAQRRDGGGLSASQRQRPRGPHLHRPRLHLFGEATPASTT